MKSMKRFLNKKQKGQTLLIVVVVSTLALLIMLAMADRILLSRVNVQRAEEFDRSVEIAENKVNEIIRVLNADNAATAQCIRPLAISATPNQYTSLDTGPEACNELKDQNARIYGRIVNGVGLTIAPNLPITHIVGQTITQSKPTTGVVLTCDTDDSSRKFIITRVYLEAGTYYADKATFNCTSTFTGSNAKGNVNFYSARPTENRLVSGQAYSGTPPTRQTVLVRIKAHSDVQASTKVNVVTFSGTGAQQSSTGKYEFVVNGLGDLGSDSAITFERPISGNAAYSPGFLDYVYFGEDF